MDGSQSRCRRCGRPLRNLVSVAAGMGRTCRGRTGRGMAPGSVEGRVGDGVADGVAAGEVPVGDAVFVLSTKDTKDTKGFEEVA